MNAKNSVKTTPPRNKSKSNKKLIPYILLVLVPVVLIVIALIFFNKQNPSGSSVLDDSAVSWSTYSEQTIELEDSLKISNPGVYTLSGEISDGMIEINTSGIVKLILNGVTVKNSSGPAILVSEAETVFLETVEGTTNTFSDSSSYKTSDEDICATVFSKDDLVLQGSGTLIVTGNYEDGIVSKDDLKITSGTYKLDTKDEGIRGRDSVEISGGTFEISAGGDAIKSNNSDEVGKGTVKISGGDFSISAGDDGIHAESALEISGGTINIEKSYEGLEGSSVTISGGDIKVVASDDGVNAAGGNDGSSPNMARYQASSSNYKIEISGGNLYVNSQGDGLDSNGSLTVSGGAVVVDGPINSANGALDAEAGVFYNGGSLIAVGASGMATAPSEASSGHSLSVYFDSTYSAGTKLSVKDSSGNLVLSHVSSKSFSHASLSSEQFKEGETYIIYINEAEVNSVTISGKTSRVGSGAQEMMMGPGGGGAPAGAGGNQRRGWNNP
ncbi:carbohydrate-binding domain-containing protein [Candidatus Saccharibacteria bacterium]|nr:carbohydrate-binding domain-containing protein [Candidatus Saccharibacteria bacterium]